MICYRSPGCVHVLVVLLCAPRIQLVMYLDRPALLVVQTEHSPCFISRRLSLTFLQWAGWLVNWATGGGFSTRPSGETREALTAVRTVLGKGPPDFTNLTGRNIPKTKDRSLILGGYSAPYSARCPPWTGYSTELLGGWRLAERPLSREAKAKNQEVEDPIRYRNRQDGQGTRNIPKSDDALL